MSKVSLVIMAAGIGSRFKGGIKQLTPVGPNGEVIMDYSIYDAVEAGFDKVVFIIRKELEEVFRETVGDRWASKVEVEYVYQELSDIPEGFEDKLAKRSSPWGTGQAILCCKDVVDGPFAVINADDYYGPTAYEVAHIKLTQGKITADKLDVCMVGFILANTLSENGAVTRGICKVDEEQKLLDIHETYSIQKCGDIAKGIWHGKEVEIDLNSSVSMNMWGFFPEIFDVLDERFVKFLDDFNPDSKEKQEYLLPRIIGQLLREDKVQVKVLHSPDKWFGVTYMEDREAVVEAIKGLTAAGLYPEKIHNEI